MKVRLDTFDNSWYKPGSKFKILLWMLFSRFFINTSIPWPFSLKRSVLIFFGASLGKGLVIKPKVQIKYPWLLTVGDYCWIGEKVWIDNLAKVQLGSHVCLSQGVMLLTGNHDYKKETFDLIVGEITLKDGVWLAAQSVICPGTTAEENSLLTVGSIASKTLEKNTVYQGNPAQETRKRV